jgi:hypothetical protein
VKKRSPIQAKHKRHRTASEKISSTTRILKFNDWQRSCTSQNEGRRDDQRTIKEEREEMGEGETGKKETLLLPTAW